MFVTKSMAVYGLEDPCRLKCLFVAGVYCQLLVAKTALPIWANLLLKHQDAVLGKIKDDISFESFMDLQNFLLSGSVKLFLKEAIEKFSRGSSL